MWRYWRMLRGILTPSELMHFYVLTSNTIVLAAVEVAGIASIMPFIAVVVDTSVIDTNPYLRFLYEALAFNDHKSFLVALGSFSFLLLIVSNGLGSLGAWLTFRFCYLRRHDLSMRLLDKYLRQSYLLFLRRSPAELYKVLSVEIERVVVGTLMSGIGLIADVVAAGLIVGVLFLVDPLVTITTLLVLGAAYVLLFFTIQRRVSRLGEEFTALTTEVAQRTREALDGAKEIKILGREKAFVERLARPHLQSVRNSIQHDTLEILPHHGLEALAFGGIIAMTLYFLNASGDSSEALSMIALYAFAAYRLIPALKDIFHQFDDIRYNAPGLELVCRDFEPQVPDNDDSGTPLGLREAIDVRDVCYQYPGTRGHAVDGLSMRVEAGCMTCVMGQTGAGKSTAIDLILGLLEPEAGEVVIDGAPIGRDNVRRWQASIGYVPQTIYLTDDTIARNIAMGEPDEAIDEERMVAAARLAEMHEFVADELGEGYQTVVGDRGLRLSGGQRQRIGIARAIYRDPSVLVLDEATSALDRETEERVLSNLMELTPARTILFVSHRTSVARYSRQIFVLSGGKVVARGSHAELARDDSQFRTLLVDG